MKVDNKFASRVAELAAEMIADGGRYGTFDNPDINLLPGAPLEHVLHLAAYKVWGGPGWWRRNMSKAQSCLQSVRWQVCEDDLGLSFFDVESQAKRRWGDLDIDETVLMLLFAAQLLKSDAGSRSKRIDTPS